jgi:hypothetical protein
VEVTPEAAVAGVVDDPASQQAYMWNRNNPLNYSDPSGFCTIGIATIPDPICGAVATWGARIVIGAGSVARGIAGAAASVSTAGASATAALASGAIVLLSAAPAGDFPEKHEHIDNKDGKAIEISGHVADQAAQRDITTGEIENALDTKGQAYTDPATGEPRIGYQDPKTGVFVGTTPDGIATTVIRAGLNYLKNLVNNSQI